MQQMRQDHLQMTIDEARAIINTPGYPNDMRSLEAIGVALSVLGDDATMGDIYRWAEKKEDGTT